MADLLEKKAKICLTAAGCLVHNNKVLLVKHKKIGIWLNPGGHLEEGEIPHQAAEREFWEETGVKVQAYSIPEFPQDELSEVVPNPIVSNLHWISQKNYDSRRTEGVSYSREEKWQRGCEQHLVFLYLVRPVGKLALKMDPNESTDIQWFDESEIDGLATPDQIQREIHLAFALVKQ
jgi:8-oxo-dGTP pyrophosphatase MutT (NUDIX family)